MNGTFLLLLALLAVAGNRQQQPDGKAVFETKGNCFVCHGKDAKGTVLAPNLTDPQWLNVDGSLEQITALISKGVPKPKKAPAPMPAMGGAKLSKDEIDAVARYVVSLSAPPAEAARK
ncbi:MAG TPA: c-type cytochrome [Longimicrobiales bacterium]